MKTNVERLLELAGIPLDSPQARRLIETQNEEEKKVATTNLKLQELDTETKKDETEEEKVEDEESKNSITVAPAVATPPVLVGGAAPVAEQPPVDQSQSQPQPTTTPAAVPAMSSADVVKMFFEMRDQVHLYHLQTESFAEHKALNDFYDTILDIADTFMEAYQGAYGRASGNVTLTLKAYSKEAVAGDIKVFAEKVKQLQKTVETNTDLVNLLDELLNSCNKTVYLLTLK